MADQPDTAPEGVPGSPGFAQAFGFKLDPSATIAGLQGTIDTAQQVVGAFNYAVSNSLMQQVANSAVFTDGLRSRIGSSLQGQIDNSRDALAALQNPIMSSVVNQLGATVEATMPMGVRLPQPGQEAPCPDCVTIRVSAQSGDLGPALACFRATALPLRDSRGIDYATRLNWIEGCLPPDTATHNAFAVAIAAIIADPTSQNPTALPAFDDPPTPAPTAPPSPTAQVDFWTPAGLPIPAQYAGQTLAQLPTAPPSVSPPPTYGGVTKVVAPPVPAPAPTLAPPPPISPVASSIPVAPPSPPLPPQTCRNPTGLAQLCQMLQDGTAPFNQWNAAWGLQPSYSGEAAANYWGYAGNGSGITTDIGMYVSCPVGSSCTISWVMPATTQVSGVANPCSTVCNGVNLSALTAAGVCQPITTPPTTTPVVTPTGPACIPICGWTPPPAPTCPPVSPQSYDLYCSSDKVLYVIQTGTSQRSQFDALISSGDPSTFDWTAAAKSCRHQRTPEQPEQPAPSEQPPIFQAAQGCGDLFRFAALAQALAPDFFTALATATGADLPAVSGTGSDWVNNGLTQFRNMLLTSWGSMIDALVNSFANSSLLNCSGTANESGIIAARLLLGVVTKYVGGGFENTEVPLTYAQNSLCPYKIPSIGEATTAWLGNTIDQPRLQCIVEANGGRWDSYSQVIDASRTKLSPAQYAFLARRQFIDVPTALAKIRNTGVTDVTDANGLYEFTRQIPPPSDIIGMMTRDAADTINIDWSKEDALFPQKYTGNLQLWGQQQGIEDEYMQMLWRAHFSIPAPGQLATMLHRLSRLPAGDPAYVDLATVRQALIQQDISPKWVDQFVAISYNPLTRIDARRAYEVGALSTDALTEAYLNLGYSPANAATLVQFNKVNITRTFLRRSEVTQLAKGEISDAEFQQAMEMWGAQPDAIQKCFDRATILRSVASRKRCIDAYRKRYLIGEYDDQYAISLVQGQQIDLMAATVIVSGWTCELQARGKLFSAEQLNGLYVAGLIDEVDYVSRATKLGWDNTDAVLMLRKVQRAQGIKNSTQQAKDLAQQAKTANALQRALARSAAAAANDAAKAAAAVKTAQKLKDLRTKRLLKASELYSKHSGTPLPEAIVYIQSLYVTALQTAAVTNDEVIAALSVIASDTDISTPAQMQSALTTALTVQAS